MRAERLEVRMGGPFGVADPLNKAPFKRDISRVKKGYLPSTTCAEVSRARDQVSVSSSDQRLPRFLELIAAGRIALGFRRVCML